MTESNSIPQEMDQDQLVVRHPDGVTTKMLIPTEGDHILRIGRELDNDIVLPDPRTSRHHAEVRRTAKEGLEIRDVGSVNGTIVGSTRLQSNEWRSLAPGQLVIMGDTRILWEQPLSAQDTVGMMPVAGPKTAPAPRQPQPKSAWFPWVIGLGALAVIGLLIWGIYALTSPTASPPAAGTAAGGVPADISRQTPEGAAGSAPESTKPAEAPPSDRPLAPAAPSVAMENVRFLPVISGALFDTEHVYMIITVRVENLGDEPFVVSTGQFQLETDAGETIKELGQEFASSEFKRLGVTDRFDDLILRSGGSVSEELIFYLKTKPYDLSLNFTPANFDPLALEIGTVLAGQELALLLGTPVAGATEVAVSATLTKTATSTAVVKAAPTDGYLRSIPDRSLVGTIAYADFNGSTYDLYLGNVATGESAFWRGETSQPAFSHQGDRLAYHSWANDSRGLITSNLDHSNGFLVGTFLEDQLPTWSPDDSQLLFLSRRTGTRQSQLYLAPSNVERPEAEFVLEGEYPTWHAGGMVVFKGWGNSGVGLQAAPGSNLNNHEALTDYNGDTAPSISPDGKRIAFMSNRDNNWDIYVINSDGSGLKRLTSDDAQDGLPAWSPDGKAIAFVSNRGGPWAVWAMTANGAGIEQLFTYQGGPDGFVASEPTHDTTRGWAEERISWTAATY